MPCRSKSGSLRSLTTASSRLPAAVLLLIIILAVLSALVTVCHAQPQRQFWYIPTRLTARIPCLDEHLLSPGRTMEQEHSSTSFYRWVQSDGNIIGSGFYQSVRLLRLPANHNESFYLVHLECLLYNWATDLAVTIAHEVNFYEGPVLTIVVDVGLKYRRNFTDFVDYLGRIKFVDAWCLKNEQCINAVVAPVRSPQLEFPRLFAAAAAFNRTPLGDLLGDLRTAEETGLAPDFLFHVNFILRLSQSNRLQDLCNPKLPRCSRQLLAGRKASELRFSEATVQTLDSFSEERATIRKLMTKDQRLVESPLDALNFSLRLNSMSLCPPGYGPGNLTTQQVDSSGSQPEGVTLVCVACPPGTHGSNGLNCFAVPNDYYAESWGTVEVTPCPDYFVTGSAGASSKMDCTFNGTTPEKFVMIAMSLAWQEIETVFYGSMPGVTAVLLIVYLFLSAYALFWQLHRLVMLMQYKHRRGMSDRLMKRFIAEAYLRDLRRLQYWCASLEAAKPKFDRD